MAACVSNDPLAAFYCPFVALHRSTTEGSGLAVQLGDVLCRCICLGWPASSTSLLPCIMLLWRCAEATPKAVSLWQKRGNSEKPSVTCQEYLAIF